MENEANEIWVRRAIAAQIVEWQARVPCPSLDEIEAFLNCPIEDRNRACECGIEELYLLQESGQGNLVGAIAKARLRAG
jgi:hypothetical protein